MRDPIPGMSTSFGAPEDNDDEFSVDLSEAPVGGGYLIPDGNYPAVLVDLRKGFSKSGNPQWIWTFAIMSGEHAGKEFPLFTAIVPSALWKVAETVETLGLGKGGTMSKFTKSDAISRRCIISIRKDTYNGQERSSIAKVLPHPDGPGPVTGFKKASDDPVPF
jgi:hypothetical protein